MPEPDADSEVVPAARRPWAVRVPLLVAYASALLTAVLFTGLMWVGLTLLVPRDVIETSPGTLALVMGAVVGGAVLLVGPLVGWLVTGLLRRVAHQGLHVVAFTVVGAVSGGLFGALFGPDLAVMFGATLGISAGLARLAVIPFARTG